MDESSDPSSGVWSEGRLLVYVQQDEFPLNNVDKFAGSQPWALVVIYSPLVG